MADEFFTGEQAHAQLNARARAAGYGRDLNDDEIGDAIKATGYQSGGQIGMSQLKPLFDTIDQRGAAMKAAAAPPTPTPTPKPTPTTGSPVAPNGTIPPPAPPTPVPQTQSAALPPRAPEAQASDSGRAPQAIDLSQVPDYQARTFHANTPQANYGPAYQADQIGQFSAPDQSAMNTQQNALMQAILANPQSMSPDVVAQMKESQKQQALLMRGQRQQGLDQNAIARGVVGSGQVSAQGAGYENDMMNQILESNRNLDVTAAQTNWADRLQALQASEALASGQMGRATQGFGAQLAGQQAQAGTRQAAATSGLQRDQLMNDAGYRNAALDFDVQKANAGEAQFANQSAVQKLLSQFGINQGVAEAGRSNYALDLQAENQRNTSLLDSWRAQEQARQANAALQTNQAQFGDTYREGQRQFDTGQFNDMSKFGQTFNEGQRQYNTSFGENQRQYNTNFGENQRQYNQNFGENQRQFDIQQVLEQMRLASQNRQFDDSMGYNYTNMNNNNNQNLLNWLMGPQ